MHQVLSDSKYKLNNNADYLTFFYQQSQVLLFFVVAIFVSVGYFCFCANLIMWGGVTFFAHTCMQNTVCFQSINIKQCQVNQN